MLTQRAIVPLTTISFAALFVYSAWQAEPPAVGPGTAPALRPAATQTVVQGGSGAELMRPMRLRGTPHFAAAATDDAATRDAARHSLVDRWPALALARTDRALMAGLSREERGRWVRTVRSRSLDCVREMERAVRQWEADGGLATGRLPDFADDGSPEGRRIGRVLRSAERDLRALRPGGRLEVHPPGLFPVDR